jgi:hypothetical protein
LCLLIADSGEVFNLASPGSLACSGLSGGMASPKFFPILQSAYIGAPVKSSRNGGLCRRNPIPSPPQLPAEFRFSVLRLNILDIFTTVFPG